MNEINNETNNCELESNEIVNVIDREEELPWFMLTKSKVNYKAIGDLIINEIKLTHNSKILTIKDSKEMLIFRNGYYVVDQDYVQTEAQKILNVYSDKHKKEQISDYVKTETLIDRSEFNKHDSNINLKNGIYNHDTNTFRCATVNDLFTYQYPVKYDPNAKCPEINKFINRILEPDSAKLIKEEIAYCYMPGQSYEKIMAWVGEGQNGKTTLMAIISALFGKQNMSFASMQQLSSGGSQSVYYQANLFGKVINMCGDMSNKSVKYFDFIKKASSNDPIAVRHAYGEKIFTFVNNSIFIFAMNEWPEFSDTSDGFFRRILYTEFNALITESERIKDYYKILTKNEELSGFFNMLMESLKELKSRGRFCIDTDIDIMRAAMTDTESVDLFLSSSTDMNPNGTYFKNDLYNDYIKWCGTDIIPMFKSPFFRHLNHLNIKSGERKDYDGNRKRVYIGIKKHMPVQVVIPKIAIV